MTRAVVLFTRDLRVRDHAALHAAADVADEVVPLFVFDGALRDHRRAPARHAFLLESLGDLRGALRRRGGELFVRRGDPVAETLRVAHEADAQIVFVGEDASSYAQRRQHRLARACASERIELRVENTIAAVAPGELAPAGRDHYRVFTPYWRRWRELPLPEPLHAPARVPAPDGIRGGELRPPATAVGGGERAGLRRLDTWLSSGLNDYERARNDLAGDTTSRLSAYLHFGCVSAGEVITRARRQGAVAEAFLRQLCWRDFYLQLLAANPRTAVDDLRPRERAWTDDDDARAAWAEGRTGFPLVDAAMRQLRAEGWIHNRARLVVGSFLTKTLGIDWRFGADVFFQLLLDGDVANNVGNWQWVAGTGVDSRPNRYFNPVAQGKRLDPKGDFVRRYVAELAELPGATVHEPWRAPLAARAPEYPSPIVERLRPLGRGLHSDDSARCNDRDRARSRLTQRRPL